MDGEAAPGDEPQARPRHLQPVTGLACYGVASSSSAAEQSPTVAGSSPGFAGKPPPPRRVPEEMRSMSIV